MLNNQQIQNNWPTIKTQVLSRWNKLSEADVEKTHGSPKSLGQLVHKKYGNNEEFDKTYERICMSSVHSSKSVSPKTEITPLTSKTLETHPGTGISQADSMGQTPIYQEHPSTDLDEVFHGDSPERRLNANYAKIDHHPNINREADDELSAYSTSDHSGYSRSSVDDENVDEYYNQLDQNESYADFTSPDEFYPSQDPSVSSDIPLGRDRSSATKLSTAKAAPKSSEVSSNDAKKKM